MITNRLLPLLTVVLLVAWHGNAIELPQFSSKSYSGWTYNHSTVVLNAENITKNNIVLYVSASGKVLMLTSPRFECEGGETINIYMRWMADQWQDEGFVPENTALTVGVLDDEGTVRDSVTYTPVTLSRSNYINILVNIPTGMTSARLRFVCWKATVSNCNAIRKMELTLVEPGITGDVNGDGEVSIADVNAIVDMILSGTYEVSGDVNGDGEVTVADVNAVVDIILASK